MKVSVIGTGYVGLVTGATLADLGNKVVCLDILEEKINMLNSGKSPIYEPGLDELLKKGLKSKNLIGSTEIEQNVRNSDITFICVGTPSDKSGNIDLSYIKSASSSIGRALRDKNEKHNLDKSGKSFVYQTIFDFPNGYSLVVECYDWEGKLEKEYMDKLVVGISSKEFIDFVDSL